ncbi:MAG: MATE family efflux transporter [Phycisphaeraceae bacterium]|nr:MATE family efflux transporter [Phycisphaeraceae bacterium]
MSSTESQPAPAAAAARPSEPSPLWELLRIAAPTVATMTSYSLMTFTDKFLVVRLGSEPIYLGAQGNGGLISWVPISIAHGTLTIINTYVSQNMGAGRPERGAAYAWNGLWLSCLYWLAVLVPFGFAIPYLFAAARIDPAQAALATTYGQILIFGSILTMGTRTLGQYFYGLHKAGIILIAGVIANIFNIFASMVLAFGNAPTPDFSDNWLGILLQPLADAAHAVATGLGIPRLGLAGAAWGTVIATFIESAIPAILFLSPKFNARYHTRRAWRWSTAHIKDLARLGWPGGVMFGNEMVCWGYFMVYLVSSFGKEHATAGWIAHQYMQLSFMPAVGIHVACTAIVGKYMGMGRPDLAARRAWLGLKLSVVYMVTCGVLMVVYREPMVRFFIDSGTTPDATARIIALGSMFLIATATFQAFDAVAMTLSGSLRGAGDTVVPGIVTVVLSWVVIVGAGTAFIHILPERFQPVGGWIGAALYIFLLAVFLTIRFVGGKWKLRKVLAESSTVGH